jgi:hypothetical protein
MGRACSTHGRLRRSLEGPSHKWEDNIRTDLKEIVWEGVGWVPLA